MAKKHGSNTWDNYLKVHEKVLNSYGHSFVNSNVAYQLDQITENYYTLEISRLEIRTLKSNLVLIKIQKDVEVSEGVRKKTARTYNYSYHAWYAQSKENIIRYCGPHVDHREFHHKHTYDRGKEINVERLGNDDWPHVNEFFDELINNY